MHERFVVDLQLSYVVSFVLRVPGLEEGGISSGKAWGWTTGTLRWMLGSPGTQTIFHMPSTWFGQNFLHDHSSAHYICSVDLHASLGPTREQELPLPQNA